MQRWLVAFFTTFGSTRLKLANMQGWWSAPADLKLIYLSALFSILRAEDAICTDRAGSSSPLFVHSQTTIRLKILHS